MDTIKNAIQFLKDKLKELEDSLNIYFNAQEKENVSDESSDAEKVEGDQSGDKSDGGTTVTNA